MPKLILFFLVVFSLVVPSLGTVEESDSDKLQLMDIFSLEYASDPQISPDGEEVVYVRNFMDVMKDKGRSSLWLIKSDGSENRHLTTGNRNDSTPRWCPDGRKLLYVSSEDGTVQLYLRWMDTGQTAKLTQLSRSPAGLSWSPDGRWIAFSMLVPERPKPIAKLPAKPKGAEWAQPPTIIESVRYRADGTGFLENGYTQLFVLYADGGTPRQVTSGRYHHRAQADWTPDSRKLLFSANRNEDWEYSPLNTEVYELEVASGDLKVLTNREGPDRNPKVSPNGATIAYLGFDDRLQGYQVTRLYLMDADGSSSRLLSSELDRSISDTAWRSDGQGLFIQFDDRGNTRIAFIDLEGKIQNLVSDVGGVSLGRPYSSGSFSASENGRLAYTLSRPDFPADVAVWEKGQSQEKRLTDLNADLWSFRRTGEVEEILYKSSYDGRDIQGWIAKPPDFDPQKKYPLILEIHGGPFASYGPTFSAEIQLYAAAGYIVLYTNPRGSTSYGEEFGNLIHHNYPGQDYDDLMSGVDAVIDRGYVDPKQLFVTGGSGGGVLSAWIVGKTDRFAAAVVAKPVINWYSFSLTSDGYVMFSRYWFPGPPWEYQDQYMKRSPISLVGNVTTPTMLLTGESDLRTPIAESEQYYQALKLRKIDSVLVRIPGASHGIANRPSRLIAKVAHVLAWFEKYRER